MAAKPRTRAELDARIPFPHASVVEWFAGPSAQERLSPPWWPLELVSTAAGVLELKLLSRTLDRSSLLRLDAHETGARFELQMSQIGVTLRTHVSALEDSAATRLRESFDTEGIASRLPRAPLARVLSFRVERARHDLTRLGELTRGLESGDSSRLLQVAVTGASGLVGRALTALLRSGGHRVRPLVRRATRPDSDEIHWDPAHGELERSKLEGLDAVVHLAGENVGAGRWNGERKRRIYESRVFGTQLLARELAQLKQPPRVWISASAIGIYGDRGSEVVDADAPLGSGFLADVCRAWEAATSPAEAAGLRVVKPRLGMVVTAKGGALARMAPVFRLGLGGPMGSGEQLVSWIALDDLLGILLRALWDERLRGPIDAVAPQAVRQADFARQLAHVLKRPSALRVPSFAVRRLFGQMGEELLLASTHVRPSRLEAVGFEFMYPSLEACLRTELGRVLDPARPTA